MMHRALNTLVSFLHSRQFASNNLEQNNHFKATSLSQEACVHTTQLHLRCSIIPHFSTHIMLRGAKVLRQSQDVHLKVSLT